MTGPSALIYGHDGFDRDVLHNLTRFYRQSGHRVAVGRTTRPADVLVVQRAPDLPLDFTPYRAVHVWDYVGTPIDRMLAGPTIGEHVTVFASSSARATALGSSTPARVEVLVPPVAVDLWRKPVREARYGAVHIGNFKPFYADGTDPFAARFLEAIAARRIDVWGAGWGEGPAQHGPLGQFRTSAVYAAAESALGMMYPFQRAVSFSGRFWQAPLNGCRVLSEPSVHAGAWPGVEATEYAEDLDLAPRGRAARSELQDAAAQFWSTHWTRARDVVQAAPSRQAAGGRASVFDVAITRARLTAQRLRP